MVNYYYRSNAGNDVSFSGDLAGTSTAQEVIGLLANPLPHLTDGYLNWTGTQWQLSEVEGGGPGNEPIAVPFNYQTASPLILQAVTGGQIIYLSNISITTSFNGNTTLQLGTITTPNLIFGTTDVDTAIDNEYNNESITVLPTTDLLILTISATSPTQGAATLYYSIK